MSLRKNILAITLLIVSAVSFSQEWEKFHSEQGFDFYIKYAECDIQDTQDLSWALIKVENTNSYDAEVKFYYEQYMDGKCSNCGVHDEEHLKSVKILKENSKEGKCHPAGRKGALAVFHKFLLVEGRELTDLKIVGLKHEKIKIK